MMIGLTKAFAGDFKFYSLQMNKIGLNGTTQCVTLRMDRQINNWKEEFKTSEFGDIFSVCRKILLLLGIKKDIDI